MDKPLKKQAYDFVLDTVGGDVASTLIPQVAYDGRMSMCGNAGGVKLTSTVLPFILIGVNILGIDSVNVPIDYSSVIWARFVVPWYLNICTLYNDLSLD